MEYIFYLNSILILLYLLLLILDIYDNIFLLSYFTGLLLLTTTIYDNSLYSNLICNLSQPIIYFLLYLSILSNLFKNSIYLKKCELLFKLITNKQIFIFIIFTTSCLLSGFLNNSLIVSLYIPIINNICKINKWNTKLIYLSLSFISMLGGSISLIGSSTNILAKELLKPVINLNLWSLTPYSLICCIFGILYLFLINLYYNTNSNNNCFLNSSNINIEIKFFKINDITCHLIGRNIKQSNINNLEGLQLCGIKRDTNFFSLPTRSYINLLHNDILIYIGNINNFEELIVKIDNYGLKELNIDNSILPNLAIGKLKGNDIFDNSISILKNKYNLLLIGIFKNQKIYNIDLNNYKFKNNEYIIVHGLNGLDSMIDNMNIICNKTIILSNVKPYLTTNIYRDNLLLLCIISIFISSNIKFLSIYQISLISILILLSLKIINLNFILKTFNEYNSVIVGTALSLLMSKTLEYSGIIDYLAIKLIFIKNISPLYLYIFIHFISSFLSIILSNASVVSILIPIIKDIFKNNLLLEPISLCLIHGASCSFASPTGYHTNLMIYNIGGYKCFDFFLIGIPLHFIISIIFGLSIFYIY